MPVDSDGEPTMEPLTRTVTAGVNSTPAAFSIRFAPGVIHWAIASTWTHAPMIASTLFGFDARRAGRRLLGAALKD